MKGLHLSVCKLFFLFLFVFISLPNHAQTTALHLGELIKKDLKPGDVHQYSVALKKNQFGVLELIQDEIDIIITAFDEEDKKIAEFDSPNGQYGPEPIHLISDQKSTFRLEVKPLNDNGEGGRYTLSFLKVRKKAKTPEGKVDQLFYAWDTPESPGASIAVVQNGQVVYQKGYGSANLEYGIPNTTNTIFHIASVSKQFTAFAIAMLADQGKIDLDDDIRKYLPEIPDFGEKISIRQLAHHMSGLRDQWNLLAMAGWRLDDVITKEHILKLISHQQDLNFKPGEEFLYCNTGFTLMAEIVSRVSEQSFAEWTQENIFQPLGMNNTLFYDDHEKIVKNRAYSYGQQMGGYKKRVLSYANVGATSLFTTVADLAKWSINFDDLKVGNKAIMDQMHQKGILNNGKEINYAFGQSIGEYKGLKMVSHGGADAGYRTFLGRFPDQDFAVIVFSNLASFNPGGMAFKVADIYLEDHFSKEKETAAEESNDSATEKTPEIEVSETILESYTGRYEIAPNFILTISRNGQQLLAQATGQQQLPLIAVSENEFSSDLAKANVVFEKNDQEKIYQAILKQGGQEITMPRLEDFDPKQVDLSAYAGIFYSPELQTTYELLVEKDQLIARHQRHPDLTLEPIKADQFSGNTWFLGQVKFIRDEGGAITGCSVSNGRVRNLHMEKMEK